MFSRAFNNGLTVEKRYDGAFRDLLFQRLTPIDPGTKPDDNVCAVVARTSWGRYDFSTVFSSSIRTKTIFSTQPYTRTLTVRIQRRKVSTVKTDTSGTRTEIRRTGRTLPEPSRMYGRSEFDQDQRRVYLLRPRGFQLLGIGPN